MILYLEEIGVKLIGVIIDFKKQKIYLTTKRQEWEAMELLNHLGDPISENVLVPAEYAYLTHQVSVKPYHEALISV